MTEGADAYAAFAGFYDQWAAKMDADIEFYRSLALEADGAVVELGVGNGRVAIPIAQAGRRVIGVDSSRAMLDQGRRRAAAAGVSERISFVQAPMEAFVADTPVELVAIPFRSFMHLLNTTDQLQTLANIHRSLAPRGRLAMNVFLPDPIEVAKRHGKRVFVNQFSDEQGRRCELWSEAHYQPATQRVSLLAIREAYDEDRLVDTTEAPLELRLIYRYEMEHLLARAGFEIDALYGWFDRQPFTEASREMVWVARKA